MLPLQSTTRQVGAGVSGTLKSAETRRILLPFSEEWVTVPVLAFGPWNGPDVCDSRFAAKAPPTSVAASAQTDSKRLSCCTSVLLQFWFSVIARQSRRHGRQDRGRSTISGNPPSHQGAQRLP